MYLLHVEGPLRLTKFVGAGIPPYAILSHTWDDDELSFEDVEQGTGQNKAGYKKVEFCIRQAVKEGLKYCWVDTCCINKASINELTEAINSMFRWYQNAEKCYVYLSDVPDKPFRLSRWFTRGWTLQELLAPGAVVFFSSEGRRLGDKKSLLQEIHEITQVPTTALTGHPLAQFSVKEKMSWIAERQTFDEEDMVYSLFGLLDISMPVHYGEGRDRANSRLHQYIERSFDPVGRTLIEFVPKQDDFSLPFDLSKQFVESSFIGRTAELAQINEELSFNQVLKVVVLYGLGGVGKTQLAIEYARQHKTEYTAVLWMNGSSDLSLEQSFADAAKRITSTYPSSLAIKLTPGADNRNFVTHWLKSEGNNRWLLVMDDCDESRLNKVDLSLHEMLHGHVIITTRGNYGKCGNHIPVNELNNEDCLEMLETYSQRPRIRQGKQRIRITSMTLTRAEPETVELVKVLKGLPLAISQAGSYLRQRSISTSDYLQQFESSRRSGLELLTLRRQSSLPENNESSLPVTLDVCYRQIKSTSPNTTLLLKLYAFFGYQDIWYELLQAGRDDAPDWFLAVTYSKISFDSHMQLLCNYGLVESHKEPQGYKIHSYVHRWIRTVLRAKNQEAAKIAFRCISLTALYHNHLERQGTQGRLLVHADSYLEYTELLRQVDQEHIYLDTLGTLYATRGNFGQAEKLLIRARSEKERLFGLKHPSTLQTMYDLGLVYFNQGLFEEAEVTFKRTLIRYSNSFIRDPLSTLDTLKSLARTYCEQAKLLKTRNICRRELQICEHQMPLISRLQFSQERSTIITDIDQEKLADAIVMYHQVLRGYRKILGKDHPLSMQVLNELGLIYYNQGELEVAESVFEKAFFGFERILGQDHEMTLLSMLDLGSVYLEQGKLREAEAVFRRALQSYIKIPERDLVSALRTLNSLGDLYAKQGKLAEAEALYQRLLEGFGDLLGPTRALILEAVTSIGLICTKRGKHAEAFEMFDQAYESCQVALGQKSKSRTTSTTSSAPSSMNLVRRGTEQAEELQDTTAYHWRIQNGEADRRFSQADLRGFPVMDLLQDHESNYTASEPMLRRYKSSPKRYVSFLPGYRRSNFNQGKNSSILELFNQWQSPNRKRDVTSLAQHLFSTVKARVMNTDALNILAEKVEDLLRLSSIRLNYQAEHLLHRKASFFIYKNRSQVQKSFRDLVQQPTTIQLSRNRVVSKLQANFQKYSLRNRPETSQSQVNSSNITDTFLTTPAYEWLIRNLEKEAKLTQRSSEIMEAIRTDVLKSLPRGYKVAFVKEQNLGENINEALERAITLTGSMNNAQAATTVDYLSQTWPFTGIHMMKLLCKVVSSTKHIASYDLPEGMKLNASINGSHFRLIANGTEDFIVEIAQILAWLGSGLRTSYFKNGVTLCTPSIRKLNLSDINLASPIPEMDSYCEVSFIISYRLDQPWSSKETPPGHCWHSMFRNPVLVNGFPIPIRSKNQQGTGLEIPFAMASKLVGTDQAREYDQSTFLKGFSSMLIAVEKTESTVFWHYCYKENGERIRYFDYARENTPKLTQTDLRNCRHIIGWCQKSHYLAGSKSANYEIQQVSLPGPNESCMLKGVTIGLSHVATVSGQFAIGMKDKSLHVTTDDYISCLKWLRYRYFVFWDVQAKRGWLLNGTSALLHIVRAALKHDLENEFATAFCIDADEIKHPVEMTPKSAAKVLIDKHNLELAVYQVKHERHEEETMTRDSEPVLQEYGTRVYGTHTKILEGLIDLQSEKGGQDGKEIKRKIRKHLEGWSLSDVITGRTLKSRVETLDWMGWGWVDFIRTIEATTLFGQELGELIKPVDCTEVCPTWRALPKDEFYLAANADDLNDIIQNRKISLAEAPRESEGPIWHCPEESMTKCPNPDSHSPHGCNPVQVFYPTWSKIFPRTSASRRNPPMLGEHGAFIFGHSFKFKWKWSNASDGDLEEDLNTGSVRAQGDMGDLEPPRGEQGSQLQGERSSNSTSATQSNTDSRSDQHQQSTNITSEISRTSFLHKKSTVVLSPLKQLPKKVRRRFKSITGKRNVAVFSVKSWFSKSLSSPLTAKATPGLLDPPLLAHETTPQDPAQTNTAAAQSPASNIISKGNAR